MAGRNAIPVRASGGIRRFGGDCGTAPERSRPGQSLPPAQAGIRLFPQACPPADTACGDRLCREAGPAKSSPTPGTATPTSPLYSKETSFLSNPISPGWVISPAFPPERVGSIRPSSRACVPAKGWAVPFPVLLIPRRLWKRWTG